MSKSMNVFLAWVVLLATLVTIVVNALANIIPINGLNTGEVANLVPTYFFPAGYVFSIWSLIYLGMIVYSVMQLFPKLVHNPQLSAVRLWYILTCVLNSVWIVLWHNVWFKSSLIVILVLLVALIIIYLTLKIDYYQKFERQIRLIWYSFSLYLGWISVAVIANTAVVLKYEYNWAGWWWSEPNWALTMMAVAGLLGLLMLWRKRDWVFCLVIIWASVGIAVRFSDMPVFTWVASFIALCIGIAIAWELLQNRHKPVSKKR